MENTTVDVLIIGAGPSGCVAASYLNKKGVNVKVVEKSKFPRFVVGESLLPRCMDHFDEVDLLDCLKAENFEVKNGARFIKNNVVCEFDFAQKHTEGWDWTWQVPRATFDHALTKELEKRGVDINFEKEVTGVSFDEEGNSKTVVKDIEGNEQIIEAKFIIDSSGHGRVLPRLLGLDKPSEIPKHSSIFTHVTDVNRPEGYDGTRITFEVVTDETWFWNIPFSNGKTSIGFVGPTEVLEQYEGSNTEKLREMMKLSEKYYNQFDGVPFEPDPIMIKNVAKSVKQLYGKGYALTGNSAEFLDPVFSSGVTFATESGLLAAKLAHKELSGEVVNWEKDYKGYILKGVKVFSTYVKEWYTGNLQKIFFHRPENPVIKEQICAVLAGYVWDTTNPFVKNHHRLVKTVAKIIDMENSQKVVN